MTKLLHIFLGMFLLLGFAACKLEKARPSKKQILVIASDCLQAKDVKLFSSFKKTEGIEVRILHLTADSLKKKLRSEGLNTEVDAVILSSAYNMHQLSRFKLLQKNQEEALPENLPLKYCSERKEWGGIGYDPYVLITIDDTLHKIRFYSDLTKDNKWVTNLKKDADWYPFYAPIVKRINPKSKYNVFDWIKDFNENKLGILNEQDSNSNCTILFTTYSDYQTSEIIQKSKFKKGKLIFPNQRIGGSYYNMHCYGIVKQARNYSNALKFFEYILTEPTNKRLNAIWKTFPIILNDESPFTYQNLRFKKHFVSPVRLTSAYEQITKILESIE